ERPPLGIGPVAALHLAALGAQPAHVLLRAAGGRLAPEVLAAPAGAERAAQGEAALRVPEQPALLGAEVPAHPARRVVAVVGVGEAALAAAHLVALLEHRDAQRCDERREQAARDAAVGVVASAGTGSEIAQGEPVVAGDVVDARLRRARARVEA